MSHAFYAGAHPPTGLAAVPAHAQCDCQSNRPLCKRQVPWPRGSPFIRVVTITRGAPAKHMQQCVRALHGTRHHADHCGWELCRRPGQDTQCCGSSDRKCCKQQSCPLQMTTAAEAPRTLARMQSATAALGQHRTQQRMQGPCLGAVALHASHALAAHDASGRYRHHATAPACAQTCNLADLQRAVQTAPNNYDVLRREHRLHGHVQPTSTARVHGALRAHESQRHVCQALAQTLCRLRKDGGVQSRESWRRYTGQVESKFLLPTAPMKAAMAVACATGYKHDASPQHAGTGREHEPRGFRCPQERHGCLKRKSTGSCCEANAACPEGWLCDSLQVAPAICTRHSMTYSTYPARVMAAQCMHCAAHPPSPRMNKPAQSRYVQARTSKEVHGASTEPQAVCHANSCC